MYILEFSGAQSRLPNLLLYEIVHKWIETCVDLSLEYKLLKDVAELLNADLGSRRSLSVTISGDWDIERIGSELRIKPRKPVECMKTIKTTIYDHQENVTVQFEHPSFIKVLLHRNTDKTCVGETFSSDRRKGEEGQSSSGASYEHEFSFYTINHLVHFQMTPGNVCTYGIRRSILGDDFPSLERPNRKLSDALRSHLSINDRDKVLVITQDILGITKNIAVVYYDNIEGTSKLLYSSHYCVHSKEATDGGKLKTLPLRLEIVE